ncbi:MAG: type II toxin-antitoxin system RelE/ParE family toxin [Candidatus Hydrogenedentes bacterium]|nr:type II toxin-antitoxin system RelE/ParE family toxin [Candidatus Hydrogenedentota bacterium]
MVTWQVEFCDDFYLEFKELEEVVQDELLASLTLLKALGPGLGRPHVDTLEGSKHSNMKELRFRANDGVWRAAFAFDPARTAIVLVAGDKARSGQRRFYKQLIKKADKRFDEHLERLKGG